MRKFGYCYQLESEEALQELLERIFDIKSGKEPFVRQLIWELNGGSDYLRGIAATMPNPDRLEKIADLLEGLSLSFGRIKITREVLQND